MDVAAYASLVSLMQSLDQIQQLHSQGLVSVPEKQQVLRLLGICQSLVCILEKPLKLTSEMEDLMGKISFVTVEAEMALDKEVVDQLVSLHGGDGSSSVLEPLITKFMESHRKNSRGGDDDDDGDLSLHSDLDSVVRKYVSLHSDGDSSLHSDLDSVVREIEYIDQFDNELDPFFSLLRKPLRYGMNRKFMKSLQIMSRKCCGEDDGDLSLRSDLDSVVREIESIGEKLKKLYSDFGSQKIVEKIEEAAEQDPSTPLPPTNSTVVGFEDRTRWMIDKLTDDEKSLRAIPIVGMGGIGKTTLARSLYDHPSIRRRFDKLIWCTLSQNFDVKRILKDLLRQLKSYYYGDIPDMGQRLYQTLHGRRYLIVMDDMWEVGAWETLKLYLPNNQNGSRVVVTTRNKDVAESCGESLCILSLLDHDKSWDLLREKVFGESSCPEELQKIGRVIAKSCGGLPLSLATISGVLSNSDMTTDYWWDTAENVKGIVSSTDDDHCLKVLSLSYHFLPVHLKPCLLSFSWFREDEDIKAKSIFRIWLDEGFVKPVTGKEIEDVAYEYLNDLVCRNLVLVHRRNYIRDIKICGVHDLVLELCIAELKKVKFYSIPRNEYDLFCHHRRIFDLQWDIKSSNVTWIRGCKECSMNYPINKVRLVSFCDEKYPTTSRSLEVEGLESSEKSPSMMNILYFWNLQFFRYSGLNRGDPSRTLVSKIWEMPQVRYLEIHCTFFPDLTTVSNSIILNQLQNLVAVEPKLTDEFIKRIPNLKRLKIHRDYFHGDSNYSLNLLQGFTLLESFTIKGDLRLTNLNIRFPNSLKKVSLRHVGMSWDDTMASIGSLPNLQVLKLAYINYRNREDNGEWMMKEGGFRSLKVLVLHSTWLKMWRAGNEELPALESLVIEMEMFLEIPADIGFIDTLNSILVSNCKPPTCESARRVAAKQYQCGNEMLKVYINGEFVHMEDDGDDDIKPADM